MKRVWILLLSLQGGHLFAQSIDSSINESQQSRRKITDTHVYKIKPWLDIPVTAAFVGASIIGMNHIYNRDSVPESEILALNRNDVNKFDRPIIDNYSSQRYHAGDVFLYGSMPLPLLLLFDNKIRPDAGRIGLLYLEALGTTGMIYTTSASLTNRFRPYAYNPNVPMSDRTRGGVRNSFFAGHVAMVGTSTFFTARVFCDYHPDMKCKWIFYSLAAVSTAAIGYMRLQAGQHFKTDVITGAVIGP